MKLDENMQNISMLISAVNPEKEQRKSQKPKNLGIDLAPKLINNS